MPPRKIKPDRRPLELAAALLSAWQLVGCVGGEAPSDPYALPGRTAVVTAAAGSASTGREPPAAGSRDSHLPLVDGASFSYRHSNFLGESWDENATLTATGDSAAFALNGEEDAAGEQTRSTLTIDGSRIFRTRKRVLVSGQLVLETSYDPAFLRYDEAWTEVGLSVTLDDDWSQECVLSSSASSCAPGAVKLGTTTHTYTVLDLSAPVSVPAGDFMAVKIQRDNVADQETKLLWFALGVGKVREENTGTGAIEELRAYEIP
jgi:hypothetical protein